MFDQIVSILTGQRAVLSAVVVLFVIIMRWLLVRVIRANRDVLSEQQWRWIDAVKNTATLIILFGLVFIWFPEVQTFALSITAVAVAVVIATKELILCISGSFYRTAARPFQTGDWISIGGYFGEVTGQSIVSTTLQEIDAEEFVHTGRTIAVPNSLLLSAPVTNQSFRKRFTFHDFAIYLEPGRNPFEIRERLIEKIDALSADFADVAQRYATMVERRSGVDLPDARPRVRVFVTELAKTCVKVTLFCPTDRAAALEQEIQAEFQAWLTDAAPAAHARSRA